MIKENMVIARTRRVGELFTKFDNPDEMLQYVATLSNDELLKLGQDIVASKQLIGLLGTIVGVRIAKGMFQEVVDND